MAKVESSAIREIGMPRDGELVVTFTSGRTYLYEGVSRQTYDAFLAAESKGAYFNGAIRDAFPTFDITGRRGRGR